MNKLVSAVITTCNRLELFKKALISVQKQTYKNIEIIVIDGSKTEAVQSYIKQYDAIIYVHSTNNHSNVLRNIGINASNGELLAFLDDDDTWECTKIELIKIIKILLL